MGRLSLTTKQKNSLSEIILQLTVLCHYSQVLDIILGLSQKIISNYTNHIANTPVDAPFEKFAWTK